MKDSEDTYEIRQGYDGSFIKVEPPFTAAKKKLTEYIDAVLLKRGFITIFTELESRSS